MSTIGPKPDKIRCAVQPLLDAIAPECAINLLERMNNPSIPQRGWQDDFFEKKIRSALNIDVLEYSGAWCNDASASQKLNEILRFLFEKPNNSSLTEYIHSLISQGNHYIQDLHVLVKKHFSAEKELDYSESKALVAFMRLVNVQLAFNAMALLKEIKDVKALNLNQFPGLAERLEDKDIDNTLSLETALQHYIEQQTTFSVKDRILFRCAKAIQKAVALDLFRKKDNSAYLGGREFDKEFEQLFHIKKGLETYPASPLQIGKSIVYASGKIVKGTIFAPIVFIQKASLYINQLAALPFRLLRGVAQDIPLLGSVLGYTAETLNVAKNAVLPTIEASGLFWLVLLEFSRFTTTALPKERMIANPLNIAMVELSPWASWLYVASMATVAGVSLLSLAKSALTSFKENFSGKELVKIVVQENLRDYAAHVLTEENLFVHQKLVLNVPIVLPEELKVLLTTTEQQNIVAKIARGRLQLCQQYFADLHTAQIQVVCEQDQWIPVYVPSNAHRAQPQELANLAEELDNLNIGEEIEQRGVQRNPT